MVYRKFLVFIFLLFFSGDIYSAFTVPEPPVTPFLQRELQTVDRTQRHHWIVYAEGGFTYRNAHYPQAAVPLDVKNKTVLINGKPISEKLLVMVPAQGTFYFQGVAYRGTLVIHTSKNIIQLNVVQWGTPFECMHDRLYAGLRPSAESKKIERKKDQLYHIRVLLAEHNRSERNCVWQISSPAGFGIVDVEGREQKRFYNMRDLTITCSRGQFFINDVRYPAAKILIIPREDHLSFNGKDYHGNFLLAVDQQHYYLINSLDIEDYVFSVLRTETWPGWPLEVNKVCAIASRTYVVGVIADSRKSKVPYHVKNTTQHQTYSGIHTDQTLRQAVQETHGMFLAYNNKPIVAMFDACCGGIIPAHVKGVNFTHAPYLERDYACTFCTKAKGYRWSTTLHENQVATALQPEFSRIKAVKELAIVKKDKAGVVHRVSIKGKGISGIAHINGKRFYALLKPKGLRSFTYSIKKKGTSFIIAGKGIGHHIGLCQWGAREMINRGYDYKKILQFYYPGTQLMKFY